MAHFQPSGAKRAAGVCATAPPTPKSNPRGQSPPPPLACPKHPHPWGGGGGANFLKKEACPRLSGISEEFSSPGGCWSLRGAERGVRSLAGAGLRTMSALAKAVACRQRQHNERRWFLHNEGENAQNGSLVKSEYLLEPRPADTVTNMSWKKAVGWG